MPIDSNNYCVVRVDKILQFVTNYSFVSITSYYYNYIFDRKSPIQTTCRYLL